MANEILLSFCPTLMYCSLNEFTLSLNTFIDCGSDRGLSSSISHF